MCCLKNRLDHLSHVVGKWSQSLSNLIFNVTPALFMNEYTFEFAIKLAFWKCVGWWQAMRFESSYMCKHYHVYQFGIKVVLLVIRSKMDSRRLCGKYIFACITSFHLSFLQISFSWLNIFLYRIVFCSSHILLGQIISTMAKKRMPRDLKAWLLCYNNASCESK